MPALLLSSGIEEEIRKSAEVPFHILPEEDVRDLVRMGNDDLMLTTTA